MICNQLTHQIVNLSIAARELFALFGLKHHVLDLLHLGGRPGESALLRISLHIGHAPLGEVQIGTAAVDIDVIDMFHLSLGNGFCMLVLL